MKNFILIITLNILTTSFSQDFDKEIFLKYTVRQDNESFQFIVLSGDKKGVIHYDKSKYYYWFKSQKVICTQGGSAGFLLNGKFEAFYENKQLSRKGNFVKGLKNGEWLYWRQDGTLIHTEHWRKGKIRGLEIYFDEKGNEILKMNYKCNSFTKKTADSLIVSNYSGSKKTISIFDENGVITSKKKFKNGQEIELKEKKETKLFSIFKKKKK